MHLQWTSKALWDVKQLHAFLSPVSIAEGGRAVQALSRVTASLAEHAHIGERLEEFAPNKVYRILVGEYELRYELTRSTIFILRIWPLRDGIGRPYHNLLKELPED